MVGIEHYECIQETLYLLSHSANAKALSKAIAQDKTRMTTGRS